MAFVAVLRGGSLDNLAATKFGWTWILVVSLGLQVAAELSLPSETARPVIAGVLVVTYGGAALFLALNRKLPGMIVAAAGLALNAIVISVNGAMPVSRWAARVAGAPELTDMGAKHEIAGPGTVLPFLSDVIPIPNTLLVVSIGDVILAIGVAILVYRRTIGD